MSWWQASRRILAHYYLEDAPYSENNLCSYCVTSGSEIWFGTRGGGVNLLSRDGEYANFKDRTGEGLSGKTVFGILEDTVSKNVWFSTNSGLYYYDYVSRMIRKSQIDSPNLCGAYYVRACYKTSRGEMLFGGTDGFILFNPGKIGHNEQKPKVFFTDLLINSEPVKPGVKDSPLRRSITTMACDGDDGSAIELSHRQSNLEICFSANSYLDVGKNQYAYRMLGLSERWSLLPRGQKAVQFFNLPAGSYVFEVKAANNDGLWGDEVSSPALRSEPLALSFPLGLCRLRDAPAGCRQLYLALFHRQEDLRTAARAGTDQGAEHEGIDPGPDQFLHEYLPRPQNAAYAGCRSAETVETAFARGRPVQRLCPPD